MNISIIKFGGSSIANDEKLKNAAQRTIDFVKQGNKVIVVLSAQGKTTDKLLKEAYTLSPSPNKRDLDMLASVGEQISIAKFSILLNEMGYRAISLTAWQVGITTDDNYTNASIKEINTSRILKELETNDIVVIAGFQGISATNDVTTLGRNGSDTTAIAIAAKLKQKECYIFTDIDGVYDKDPNKYQDAKKLEYISYSDMKKLCKNGATVLHDKCIEIARKSKVKIIVKSSFSYDLGTTVFL